MHGYAGPMSPKPTSVWGSRNAALAALGLNVVVDGLLTFVVAAIDFAPAEVEDLLVNVSGKLAAISTLGVWLGALGFLPWLKATYVRARELVPSPALDEELRRGPVVGFFIPFLNLVRPYRAVRVLNDTLDPDHVPPPAPRMMETNALYREPAAVMTLDLRSAKSAPVAVWWALWIARAIVPFVVKLTGPASNLKIAFQNGVVFAAAVAAFVVVWRISNRLAEVERRQASSHS